MKQRIMKWFPIPFSVFILLGLLLQVTASWLAEPALAQSNILYVAPDGNCGGASPCYAVIQDAVDAAIDSDEIRIAAGTYTGVNGRSAPDGYPNGPSNLGIINQMVYITKTVTLRGGYTTTDWTTSDPEANPTILDAQNGGRVIFIMGEIAPTVEGLQITGGNGASLGGGNTANSHTGGGVYVHTADPTLDNNMIISNTTGAAQNDAFGGGVYLYQSNGTLSDNTISGNTSGNGGGLYLSQSNGSQLNRNVISSNTSSNHGGGLYIHDGATLVNNVIADNSADRGSGVYAAENNPQFKHTTFARNSGGDGSGMYVNPFTAVDLYNTIVVSHTVGISVALGGTAQIGGVLWFGNGNNIIGDGTIAVTDEHSGDPNFASDGYHLTSASAVIDKGINQGTFDDIDGEIRPQGAAPDLGADEYSGESSGNLLSIHILAFDNRPTSTHNLAPYYPKVLEGIKAATRNAPNKTAVILADLDGVVGETEIVVVQNGESTTIPIIEVSGLTPTEDGDYDMTDGNTLGQFILWARDTYSATQSTLSYVGHGTFLAPDTDVSAVFTDSLPSNAENRQSGGDPIIALPTNRGLNPDLTDHNPLALISPYNLALALNIGTNGGSNPLSVVDLTHCFAITIEELYELSNPSGTPYAEFMTGSPNYAYFGPQMPGEVLAAMQPGDLSRNLATAIIDAYDAVLDEADLSDGNPDVDHPHVLVAVESSKIPPIVEAWDNTASALLEAFNSNYEDTKTKIRSAYTNSVKYDTTYCEPQDWELAPPDALSDMGDIATDLSSIFGDNPNVFNSAITTAERVYEAIIASHIVSGTPWFAKPLTPNWTFEEAGGIALYTDFLGMRFDDNPDSIYLSWQARWYTAGFTEPNGTGNPHPYLFTQHTQWDEVFNEFWRNEFASGLLSTAACLPDLPPAARDGELSAIGISAPDSLTVTVGLPVTFTVEISTSQEVFNPLVQFVVTQNGRDKFTNIVATGNLVTGTHQINSKKVWTPTVTGPFTLTVLVDTDNRVTEVNEDNNTLTVTGWVNPSPNFIAGDCNADGTVNAGDLSAIVLEIFEPGKFGNPGCDSNTDTLTNAGDLSCTVLIIFNGQGACRDSQVRSTLGQLVWAMPTEYQNKPEASFLPRSACHQLVLQPHL